MRNATVRRRARIDDRGQCAGRPRLTLVSERAHGQHDRDDVERKARDVYFGDLRQREGLPVRLNGDLNAQFQIIDRLCENM